LANDPAAIWRMPAPDEYDLIATNLVEGNGYRYFPDTAATTIRTPGFVLVLAGLFWAFGKSLTAVKAVNLMLSSITAWLVYRLGLRITCSAAVAVVAALLYFFYPGTILSDSRGGIETLFTFSIALFMLLLYRALESKKIFDLCSGWGLLRGYDAGEEFPWTLFGSPFDLSFCRPPEWGQG
jgi:4-amino-4-deoxy-L-arabinose transferase-like glycosyltransferase